MHYKKNPINLTPEEFEYEVKAMLEAAGGELKFFEATRRERLGGTDGIYEIDISVRFEALGADFLVLVECKHHKNPIKREVVQVLHDRIRSTGAHKGMIFATTTFQSGALEYAKTHKIALVQIVEGKTTYRTKAFGFQSEPPPWANIPPYVGQLTTFIKEGCTQCSLVSTTYTEGLSKFLSQ